MKRTILLINLVFIFAGFSMAQNGNSDAKYAKIKFDKKVHNYGKIYKSGDGNCSFEFKNVGDAPLVLTSVRSSCGCTVPKWPRKPVMPGKTAKIKVTYDTRRLGVINKQITVRSNAKNGTVVLKIRGQVINPPKQNSPEKTHSDIN
jgi:hypothetical protein